jgi:hypothetical protein
MTASKWQENDILVISSLPAEQVLVRHDTVMDRRQARKGDVTSRVSRRLFSGYSQAWPPLPPRFGPLPRIPSPVSN